MNQPTRRSRSLAPGHTLLEMLLSLVLLSIVMASVSSAVMFASKAVPDDSSPTGSLISDSSVLSRIAEDLEAARYVIEQTDHAVAVVVADRNGDDLPERIRYAWSGIRGEPLFYQLNDEAAVVLVDAVSVFDLSYTLESASETLPVAIYLGAESLVASYDSDDSGSDEQVTSTDWFAQSVTPALSADALGFLPTRAEVFSSKIVPANGQTLLELRELSGGEPGDTVYGDATIGEGPLGNTAQWNAFDLSNTQTVPDDDDLAVMFSYVSGIGGTMQLRRNSSGTGLLASDDSGDTWADDGQTLLYRLYGRELLTDTTAYAVTRQHLTAVTVSLQRVAEDRSPLQRIVRFMQAPPSLNGFAFTDFDVDPVTMDLNHDGENDWSHSAGTFPGGSLQSGVWVCDGVLTYDHKGLKTADVIRVRTRMRATDVLGPTIYGPYTIAADELLPVAVRLRDDGAGGQELVVFNDLDLETERLVLSGLPSGLVDIEVTLLPGEDLVSIKVNHQPVVSVVLDRIDDPRTVDAAVSFGSGGGVAEFGFIDIAVGGSTSSASYSGALEVDLDAIEISLK